MPQNARCDPSSANAGPSTFDDEINGVVISDRYSTVSIIRTIEAVLGLAPSSLYSAAAEPMREVFDLNQTAWDYNAIVPDLLRASQLPLPKATAENTLPSRTHMLASAVDRHDGAYWQKRLGDMDYDEEDKLDTPRFNRELWKGIMGKKPYPTERSGQDLRQNRELLLAPAGLRPALTPRQSSRVRRTHKTRPAPQSAISE